MSSWSLRSLNKTLSSRADTHASGPATGAAVEPYLFVEHLLLLVDARYGGQVRSDFNGLDRDNLIGADLEGLRGDPPFWTQHSSFHDPRRQLIPGGVVLGVPVAIAVPHCSRFESCPVLPGTATSVQPRKAWHRGAESTRDVTRMPGTGGIPQWRPEAHGDRRWLSIADGALLRQRNGGRSAPVPLVSPGATSSNGRHPKDQPRGKQVKKYRVEPCFVRRREVARHPA
ncbi:hypothetical protein BKP43_48170 [Variovorax boronicumulans]|nr:hypothetical protein BKP43_48170 [Variovorax boronicumulans]